MTAIMATTEVLGTTGNDRLTGSDGNELILGLAGEDNIYAGSGDDTLQGGDGNDYLYGGRGADSLQGGNGNDYLAGGDPDGDGGSDTLNGGDGHDAASYSFQGTNTPVTFKIAEITGGAGLQADGHGFTDTLIGIEEIHALGSEAGDVLVGSSARDIIHGRGGNDTLTGGGGNDDFGYGVDIAHGIDHITDFSVGDVLNFWSSSGTVSISTGIQSGTDSSGMVLGDARVGTPGNGYTPLYVYIGGTAGLVTIQLAGTIIADDLVVDNWGNAAQIRLAAGSPGATPGNDTLTATGTGNVVGLSGNDSITGSSGDDRLFGGRERYDDQQLTADGNDTLLGMAGNDDLRGGGGNDYLDGGDGNDNIYGSNGNGGASGTLDGADTLLGGAGNDYLHGGSGADSIQGGAGNDYMVGAQGNDTVDGGDGFDVAAYDFDGYTTSVTFQAAASTNGSSQQADGQGGTDTLSGIEEIQILGGSGNDRFIGNNARNYIGGGGGDDTLTGGGGYDTFAFQTNLPVGSDVITDLSIDDNVYFFNPNGTVTFNTTIQTGSDSSGMVQGEVRVGAASSGYTTIYVYAGGMAGPATLRLAGNVGAGDLVIGNWGNAAGVMLTGGTDGASLGDDTLSDSNFIVGMAGKDSITGSTGNDNLFGDRQLYDNGNLTGDGSDTIFGLGGSDIIRGGGGGDYLDGGDGDDTLYGSNASTPVSAALDGADTLLGGNGNDVLRGNNGDDSLSGGAGDDNLRGDAGNDTLDGGDGFDFVSYYYVGPTSTKGLLIDLSGFVPGAPLTLVDAFGGTDTLISIEQIGISGAGFNDTLIGSASDDYIEGNDGDDSITGAAGNDQLTGSIGNDTILGGAGDDWLEGGDGNDSLDGGDGNDTASLWYNAADVQVTKNGDGSFTVRHSSGTDTLRNVETLELADRSIDLTTWTGVGVPTEGPDSLTGGNGSDLLQGLGGNDTLDGGNGDDTLQGGNGDDTLILGADTASIDGGAGNDVVKVSGSVSQYNISASSSVISISHFTNNQYNLSYISTVERIDFNDAVLVSVTGGDGNDNLVLDTGKLNAVTVGLGNDTVIGGNLRDIIDGGYGKDSLSGGAGDDIIQPGPPEGDTVDGGAGNDRVEFGYYATVPLSVTVHDDRITDSIGGLLTLISVETVSVYSGGGDDTLVGSARAEYLQAVAGADHLAGNGGDDTLDAGVGNDTLLGGDGDDILNGGQGDDSLDGGAGNDVASLEYNAADVQVTKNGDGSFTVRHSSGTDTLRNIETLELADRSIDLTTYGTAGLPTEGADTLNGGDGADDINGLGGNDLINGLGGMDYLRGGPGADSLVGGDGNDALYGANASSPVPVAGDGNDTLVGGAGDDLLRGNSGDDLLQGGAGDDNLRGDIGNDTLDGGDGYDVAVYYYAGTATSRGGLQIDLSGFVPGATTTFIDAYGNTDTLIGIEEIAYLGTEFADALTGSARRDQLVAGEGNDTITGGGGDDWLLGDGGNDFIRAGAGADWVEGGDGDDTLFGGNSQSPVLMPDDGNDTLVGGLGNDVMRGSNGDDLLQGGAGDDNLRGDAGNDTLDGGEGIDYVSFYHLTDAASTGLLFDMSAFVPGVTFTVTDAFGNTDTLISIEEFGFTSTRFGDTLIGSVVTDYIDGNDGNDSISGGGGNDNLEGNNGNDTILGGAGDDWMEGGDGDDYLAGNAGADSLDGGAGRDYLTGGAGADHLDGGAGFDTALLDFSLAEAGVKVGLLNLTGSPVTIADDTLVNIERVRVYGSAHGDTITGADDADVLFGFAGGDVISGGKGDDFMAGGAGNDTLAGGAGNDHFSYNDNWDESINGDRDERIRDDADTIVDFSGGDRIQFASLVLKQPVLGAGGQDMARGDVRVEAQGSFTMLHVGLGEGVVNSVRLEGNFAPSAFALVGTDTLELAAMNLTGNGLLEGSNWNDTISGGQSDDTLLGGLGDDMMGGYADNDRMDGGAGNDYLSGGTGNDFLVGGTGNDELFGGDGVDVAWMDAAYADVTLKLISSPKGIGGGYTLTDQRGEGGQGADKLGYVEFLILSDRLVPLFRHTAMTAQGGSATAFSEEAYLAAYSDVADAVGRLGTYASGAEHYERYGEAEGRVPNAVFDTEYYVTHNPDVLAAMGNDYGAASKIAYRHYVEYGRAEGRQPAADRDADGDLYSETYYLAQNPDVAAAMAQGSLMSGYQHYISYGKAEGRAAFPDTTLPTVLFDEAFYRLENPDVANAVNAGKFADVYEHFLLNGLREGRDPNILFDTDYYLAHNPDVTAAIASGVISDAVSHYIRFGGLEGRDPSAWFDSSQYLATHADVAAAGINPLLHYLEFGQAEGRVIAAVSSGDWPL